MSNLYELSADMQSLQNAFENGEIPEDAFNDTMEGLHLALPDAVEYACKAISNANAEIAGYKEEIKRLTDAKKRTENWAERQKGYIQYALNAAGQRGIKAGTFTASIAKSPAALNVYDESLIPKSYFVPQPDKLDNAAIKEAIKAGTPVPGAKLEQGEHLNIK